MSLNTTVFLEGGHSKWLVKVDKNFRRVMDAQIRRLVIAGTEQHDIQLLTEAFNKLKQNFQVNLVQSKDSIGQDIYILLAEAALDSNANGIADECLQMFFSSSPVKSQFVGRAYLCQFRMYMPKTALEYESLDNAIPFLQKCLAFASASPRYQFLVYNASVVYFSYVRPFFRDGYRKHLCASFQHVVDVLMSIPDEQDFLWQAELLFELVRCYIDAQNQTKALDVSVQLLDLCQAKKLPLISDALQYLTVNKVLELNQLMGYTSNDDPSALFNKLLIELASVHRKIRENITASELTDTLKKIYDRIVALPTRSAAATGTKASKDTSSQSQLTARLDKSLTSYEKHRLLIEAGRLSLLIRFTDLTKVILDALSDIRLKEPEYLFEVRLLQAEYMVRNLGDNENSYHKSVLDIRMRAIALAEETVESLVRTGKDDLVQAGCTTLWNLCLPLLQTNLRSKIRRALTTLVNILERIQSLNYSLRSQAHFELAKIEEDIEQLDSARTNLLKAKELDDAQVYRARIDLALDRLRLRAELYKTPDNADDRVATIIEQAGKMSHGNKNKQRALLIEACLLLAQDTFQVVLDSENPHAVGKMRANPTAQLKGFAEHYEKCLQNIVHYQRLMSESDQDKRLKLWADLTMIARRQEIWDVCRTAARFCLLYDTDQRRASLTTNDPAQMPSLFQRDLIRLLAEIYFVAGEAEIEFIRERRIELFDIPNRPPMPMVPSAQRAQLQQESDEDWRHYTQWLHQLSTRACQHFATGAHLGHSVKESWLICRAGEYLWNYTRHLFYSNRLRHILEPLSTICTALRKIGHERELLLLVNLAVALANAYITPLPPSPDEPGSPSMTETAAPTPAPAAAGKKGTKAEQAPAPVSVPTVTSTAKNEDAKAALDVCEYALHQTKEDVAKSRSVSIGDRQTLLQLWVTIKQLLQQSIRSALSTVLGDEEENPSSLNTLSRAVIAVDVLSRLDSSWHDNKDGMNLKQAVTFMDQCTWNDPLVELQLWCRLGIIANRANEIETTNYARDKTLHLITTFQTRKVEKFQLSLANEYVSRACTAHAECLLRQQTGQKQERKEVLSILVEAASYASKADLYELTMHIARHYWNTCRPSIKRRLERALLLDSLNELIHHINTVAPKSIVAAVNEKETKQDKTASVESFKPKKQPLTSKKDKKNATVEETPAIPTALAPSAQEDALIRSTLYGVLVQIYMDRHSWHSALDVIDSALQVLPRTHHRLILYKYRVLIKSKLGLSISMDMQKFREQGEISLARMWRQVALMAKRRDHLINAYQRAIETLQSWESYWTKIDYILELASWMFSNEYFLDNVVDLIEWSIDLLLTSQTAYQKQDNETPETLDTISPNQPSSIMKSNGRREVTTLGVESGTDSDQTPMGSVKSIIPNRKLPDLSIAEVTDVRRLEYLGRCHILLAYMTRRNLPEHEVLLQKAYWFIVRLWQRGLADSTEINKDAEAEAAAAEALAAANESTKKQGGKAPPASAAKKKPGSTVPAGKSVDKAGQGRGSAGTETSIPKNAADWALFVLSDELLETYALPQAKQRGFNRQTISKPLLSFYHLDMFVRLLRDYGYNHLSLPVLSFMRVIGQNIVKSSSMNTYVLLRLQQVCQELNLLQPMQTLCQLARPFTIREDELATSRADMMIYSKLLAQQHEEEAQLESVLGSSGMKSEVRSYGTSAYSSSASRNQIADAKTLVPDLPGYRQVMNKLISRNIWLQTANLLFELHFVQESKEILQEVLLQAKTYDDQPCEKRAYVLLAEIALHEHRFDQAMDLAMQGQQVPIDEYDWYRSVSTVVESLRQDPNRDSYKQKKIQALLDTSIKRLKSIGQLHINKIMSIAYASSMLTSKRIDFDQEDILRESMINTVENKPIFYRLQGILQQYDMICHDLLSLDRYNDACEVILTRIVPIWKRFVRDSKKSREKRHFLCQALNNLDQLTELLAQRWKMIRTITSHHDLTIIQLPLQRQYLRVQLESVEILLHLFKIYAHETFEERLRRKTTHASYLAVEDFVGKDQLEKNNSEADSESWKQLIKTLPDKLIGLIISVFEMIGASDRQNRAKILFYLAQVYSILGQNFGTDYPLEWNSKVKEIITKLNEMALEKPAVKRIESRGSAGIHQPPASTETEWMSEELQAIFNHHKMELHHSMSYLGQSMECALQSLNLALAIQDKTLVRDLALLLSDSIGQFDPISSIIYLSLSQSAAASIYTENVLRKACDIPTDSELASLFTLMDRIKRDETLTNATNGLVYRTITERLKNYSPWKYMTLRSQYYDLTRDMPPFFNFLILYYSPDSDVLYAALFNSKFSTAKASAGGGGGKQTSKGAPIITTGFAAPQILRISVQKDRLIDLVRRFEQWKQEYSQLLQRYEVKVQHSRDKQAMLNSEQADSVDLAAIDDLKEQFLQELLPELNSYFGPLAPLLSQYLELEKQYEGRPILSTDHLILLVDPRLAHLPLESLDLFKHVQIGGISRDFSLQSVFSRLNAGMGIEETGPTSEADNKGKKASGKEAAEVSVELQSVDSSNTYYVTEPVVAKLTSDGKMLTPFDTLRQRFPQIMTKWKTMKQDGSNVKSQKIQTSSSQQLSTVELERVISDAQGVLYYGAHTLSELLGFYRCPTLSKNGCTIICSFDRTSTSSLINSISSITNDINTIELARSTEIALLWSSGGVKSLLLNQWKSTNTENENVLINLFTEITGIHCSITQALRLYMYPYFRPVEVDPATVAGKDAKGKGAAVGGGAGANKKARSPSPKSKQRQQSSVTDASGKKKGTTVVSTETTSNAGGSIAETVVEPMRPALQLQQINPIIFGLPHLTFTP